MDQGRHQREVELFDAACDLGAEEQSEFLQRECAGDARMLARLRALLSRDTRGERALPLPSLASASSALLEEALPERFGRYRILRVLGRGGMGVVYEAEQDHPRRSVAIKVLSSASASAQSLRRFEHEARILGRLSHPGIAQVYDAGVAETALGPRPYLVMELVRGVPLARHVEQGGLERDAKIELVARVCDAVQHAHEKGVIHRDLKPGNVIVDESGAPRVLDFGIARVLDVEAGDTTFRTRTGELLGTIAYMSPEQATGASALVDARSDVYALGVMAYELLGGRLPYELSDKPLHDAVRVISEEQPPRLGLFDRVLRGDVETIVGKAIDKERERRYATAADFALDLRRALRHEPIQARPTSGLYQLRRFARRNRKLTLAIGLAIASLVAGTTAALYSAHDARESERNALRLKGEADTARTEAEQNALRANLAAAELANEARDPIAARESLAQIPDAARGWEWRLASARIDSSALAIEDDARILDAVPSNDGAALVTISAAGRVRRWDARGGALLASVELGAPLTGPAALAADGAWVAGVEGAERTRVVLWDAATARVSAETAAEKPVESLAISPAGDCVALGGEKPFLWRPGAAEPRIPIRVRQAAALTLDATGEVLGVAYGGPAEHSAGWGWFALVDTRSGAFHGKGRRFSDLPLTGIAVGRAGGVVCVSSLDRRAYALDRVHDVTRTFAGHRAAAQCVALDHAQRRVATGSIDQTVRIWNIEGDAAPTLLSGAPATVTRVAFLPDDSGVLAVAGTSLRVWHLGADTDLEQLSGHTTFVYGVAFLGGATLVSGAWDGTLRFWDVRTHECFGVRRTGSARVLAVVADPAGSWLATAESDRVALWSGGTAELLAELAREPADAPKRAQRVHRALAVSGDGAWLAGRAPRGVTLWRTSDRALVRELEQPGGEPTSTVALSPDARWVATDARGSTIVVWDRESGAEVARLRGHGGAIEALAFAPDGSVLASGARDATVRVWDTRDWSARAVLRGHTDRVYALAFSPEGARLASGSNDTSIRVWSTQGGAALAVLAGHRDYVFSLAFAHDGESLASASGDASVRLWDARPARSVWAARAGARERRAELSPLVEELCRSAGSGEAAAAKLRADASLDAERRETALQLVLQRSLEPPAR